MSSSSAAPEVTVEADAAHRECARKAIKLANKRCHRDVITVDNACEALKETMKSLRKCNRSQGRELNSIEKKQKKLVAENKTLKEECDLLATKYKEVIAKRNSSDSTGDAIITSVSIISVIMLAYYAFNGCK